MRLFLICLIGSTFIAPDISATSICENQISLQSSNESLSCEIINSCVICFIDEQEVYLKSCENSGSEIDISGLNITHVCPGAFDDVAHLEIINLSFNNLFAIPENLFENLKMLIVVNFSYNVLEFLPNLLFHYNTKLQVLDLSHNLLKSDGLSMDIFNSLFVLQTLDLSSNLLTDVPSLKQQIFLRCFNLSHNHLKGKSIQWYEK